ncbi:hypothetical protein CONCODRAFT_81107 [Conidiobolus coronatus NRRL 28638]|uniref:Uncharacterized protein n=1 Tax=Conidiobolus coronatus (strain ATCC 28846 / CBS 209.66 / NRRL 28638) TaxID=796925 RepID=A0A137PGM8_CONC2|nr:hypothetical protein CONCODRAFT_81107 [Conidiobolus coronatus NRRL 28638]|eukprot:KXN74156.1 hypothetical protein CONCODRAFT_81107 [Conidiobolus coronatus NRRL 28638]
MMCSQYAEEYFEYLYEIETEYMCPPNYMDSLKDITWEKRAALVDWLVDVHSKFDMVPEILFLSVNLLDRFLSKMTVKDKKLQLIGATSLLISAKFEQKFIPKISELVYLAANAFTSDEVAESERYILTVVDFDINYPNPLNFLRRFSMADSYNKEHRLAAKYLLELSLLNHEFIKFRCSLIAASAIYLARLILHNLVWNETLQFYSKYKEEEMMPCIQLFITTLGTPTKFEAVDKKYSHINHFKISEFCRGWILDRHQKVTKFKEFKLV